MLFISLPQCGKQEFTLFIFKNTCFEEHLQKTASKHRSSFLEVFCRSCCRAVATIKWLGRGTRSRKNFGHHGWPMEKILVFEWPQTAEMAFKFLDFSRNIFKIVQDFSCLSKQFLETFFFLESFFFHKNPEN